MIKMPGVSLRPLVFAALVLLLFAYSGNAQNTVTGAFQGDVSNDRTGDAIPGVAVKITNVQTGVAYQQTTDAQGVFYQGLLAPGFYDILVSAAGFKTQLLRREIKVSLTGDIVPVPVALVPEDPTVTTQPTPPVLDQPNDIRVEINVADARRDGSFRSEAINRLPIGANTFTRSFDELALLLPGIAPPPQTIGDVAGPGVGPGVGSAGQFAVNGLRSRANNFTVDGSDNNDEDIGVRRQGFVALVPQPIESIQEFQVISLLAPAQFGRNIGAQVNAVSRAGGNTVHGSVYGFFNSSQLNAKNFFSKNASPGAFALRSTAGQAVLVDGTPVTVRNDNGNESFTFGQGGATIGGAIKPNRTFFFLSTEFQKINAFDVKNFAAPNIEQRGAFGTGASGIFVNPFTSAASTIAPAGFRANKVLSLFPFPNNPNGVYGRNTFTQTLPSSARGAIFSGRIDHNFNLGGNQQIFTARYNFTDDKRDIASVGEAIYGSARAKTRTNNISLFLNGAVGSSHTLFNQVRFSFGHSHLNFDELRDTTNLLPSRYTNTPFLLNARNIVNITTPPTAGQANTGSVNYVSFGTTDAAPQAPFGQVKLAGFSPLGVDVFNFPQDRRNKTFQLADELTYRTGNHAAVFGVDTRRTDLDSDLPRLSRPLLIINGGPALTPRGTGTCPNGGIDIYCFLPTSNSSRAIRAEDLLSLGAASSSTLTVNVDRPDSKVNLRYYQLDFYAQDTWRPRQDLSLSFGLRYEYNTPVKERNRLIERTFTDSRLSLAPGLVPFIAGRTNLYDADRNNFAPRVSIAYSPKLFGGKGVSVFRAGYGIFYDQILGAVVNQSRNVFPTYATFDLGGLQGSGNLFFDIFNPLAFNPVVGVPLVSPGTTNILNPALTLTSAVNGIQLVFPNAITATLPARRLDMPMAHHFNFSFEQQLSRSYTVSASYVGTSGRNLLRFTTPNLGSGKSVAPVSLIGSNNGGVLFPSVSGYTFFPARQQPSIAAVNVFETTASSRYDSFQTELRGRVDTRFSFRASYTLSNAEDDVSDVFDLAGAYALPQNSLTFAGERAPANFDIKHRFAYSAVYDFGKMTGGMRWLTNGLQLATTGRVRSGQPFTVNSTIDVNLDGNLTDRLNSTSGIEVTGNRRQPLRLATTNPFSLLAAFGQDGRVKRNSFRAGNVVEMDLSVIKAIEVGSGKLNLRADVFNFINRANFGVPVRFLEAPGFGQATSTITPGRRVQFSAKFEF